MTSVKISQVKALMGDTPSTMMLLALIDGRALTANELSSAAGVTPQTAGRHLAQLLRAGVLGVAAQGRHRYYRLAGPDVAHMIKTILQASAISPSDVVRQKTGPRDDAVRFARTCYDHLGGYLGVAMTSALLERGHLVSTADATQLTQSGHIFLESLGVVIRQAHVSEDGHQGVGTAHHQCRLCLDWSERRYHLAGKVGTAMLARFLDLAWVRRRSGSRAVDVTHKGRRMLREKFAISWD
ncbi:MAG: helix-turn-helix transcriptional regulator [Hyphomicrobiaceae bacterium]|nr:helix-turn-helix transcriptional regulator [Hyphomicrobiaceae bacterium]MCC0009400.1 helix-turn-helix transcriptional regulator [Hyphomicrobiaceae bacterium]